MLPIPGTGSVAHLEENVAAAPVELSDEEYEALSGAGLTPAPHARPAPDPPEHRRAGAVVGAADRASGGEVAHHVAGDGDDRGRRRRRPTPTPKTTHEVKIMARPTRTVPMIMAIAATQEDRRPACDPS